MIATSHQKKGSVGQGFYELSGLDLIDDIQYSLRVFCLKHSSTAVNFQFEWQNAVVTTVFFHLTIATHLRDRGVKWSHKKRGVRGGHGVCVKNQRKTNSIIQRSIYKLQMYI